MLVVRPEACWDKTEADPLFRLLYCDGVPPKVGVGGNFRLEATLWKNMSVKFSRLLVPQILLWSTRNSPHVPMGSWPAVAAECFVTFVVDCEASDWYLGRKSGAMGVVRRGHQVLDAT